MAAQHVFSRPYLNTFTAALLGLALPLSLTLPVSLTLMGCSLRGSGTAMTESRDVEAFETIEIGGAFELLVHVDPTAAQRVEISGDDNIVPVVTTTVSGGELDIQIGHGMVRPKLELRVEVWVPSLTALEASGASDITVEGLHGESFELDLSGASETSLRGAVDRFEVDISGASDLDARELHAKVVELELSGAGDAEVWASDRLDADISGAGNVRYFGETKEVHEDVAGAGSITPGS
jgi:hypothetical protein